MLVSCEDISKKNYQITAEVRDENNRPIHAANVQASMDVLIPESPIPLSKPVRINVRTDQNGIAKMNFLSVHIPGGVCISKENYYTTTEESKWDQPFEFEGTKTASIKTVLKPIKNPIQMSARNFGNAPIIVPSLGVDYGYDLELSAFVPPHGNGKHSDIIFHVTGSNDGKGKGQIQMYVRGNGEKTGFVEFLAPDRDRGSTFISDYTAPAEGYTNGLSFKFDSDDMAAAMSQRKDQNYYFRVRCQLNPDGSIKSCHYGKLYGPFTFWNIPIKQGGVASFGLHTSYFNLTPNDRNVEFDPKRNMIPDGNVQRP